MLVWATMFGYFFFMLQTYIQYSPQKPIAPAFLLPGVHTRIPVHQFMQQLMATLAKMMGRERTKEIFTTIFWSLGAGDMAEGIREW